MKKIDMHKLALVAGFDVVCIDDEFTNYEYTIRIRDIESMSYILKIKNEVEFNDVDEILQSIIIVLPKKLRKKIKKLAKKKDENNIESIIDLLCFAIEEFNQKTKYALLKEYGELVGLNINDYGYYFSYNLSRKKYSNILSLIESKLGIDDAIVVGKMKKLEYKIGYLKQKTNLKG